jgi:glutathione peroxidase
MTTFQTHKVMVLILLGALMFAQSANGESCAAWLDHDIKQLHSSKMIDLCERTKGKAVLIVNTASHCGYTSQFGSLETLHKTYGDKGLIIVGFPSDSFNQEADDEAQTANVCYKNFGVTFTMTKTISVKGKNAHPIFQHLANQTSQPSWNFNKYLISADGQLVKKFSSSVSPMSQELTQEVEKFLF